MNSEIKRLLPNKISSGGYIRNEARKIFSNRKNDDILMKNLNEQLSKNNIRIFEGKIFDPTTNKTINKLKKDEEYLLNELTKLNSNEKLLKSKSYINIYNNNPNNIYNDKKKINEKIKNLRKNKDIYMNKLGEVKSRINTLEYNQEKELGILDNVKKRNYNKFIEEYNNIKSKSLIEKKIKKLRDESERIKLIMKKDLEKQIDKKNNEINDKEKKKEEQREALLKKFHDVEREDIEKRKKKNADNLLKIKENIKNKPKEKIYLYQQKFDKFNREENNLVKLEKMKRKAYMKSIDLSELNEMRKNYEQIKSKRQLETNLKIENIKKSWVERHKLVPLYINPLSKLITEEDKKAKNEEKDKKVRIKNLKTLQKNYSNDKIPKPLKKIELKIGKENEKNEKNNSSIIKPYFVKSNSYSNLIRQKIIKEYKEKTKNKEMKEHKKDSNIDNNNINNKIDESLDKNKNKKNEVKDYLKERRKIKELKKERRKSDVGISTRDYIGINEVKNIIKEKGMDNNTVKFVKSKLESIEEKAKQKNMLLKYSGGVANKPELGDEVCDLMINSIKAKLSLIKEIDKNLNDESSSEEKNMKTDKEQSDIQEKTEENSVNNT